MTEVDKPDYATLRWVKVGMDETIHIARCALEAYVDGGYDDESLTEFTATIHKILGTLRMVQAYGASMLAEEIEKVSKGLAKGQVKPSERVSESLMLGLVQLPNYLSRLEMGEPDVPLMLLPVINDLRAARNASPASEISSYAPNLDRLIEAEAVLPGSGNPDLPKRLKRLRTKYHKGLLHWYKDDDTDAGLHQVQNVVSKVNALAGTTRLRRLMDAVEALTIVLIEGEFTASDDVKRLFSQVDRVFKQMLDTGEEATVLEFPRDLLKHLLYFVSRSHSQDSIVAGVKKEADLANSFPENIDPSASHINENENTASQDIIDAVKDVLLTDIETVKDELDLYIRGDHAETGRLAALPEVLNRVGDTLGMIGRGSLRYKLQFCSEKITAVADQPAGLSNEDLMSIATELVTVESVLKNLDSNTAALDSTDDDGAQQAAVKNLDQVLKESLSELGEAKQALETFVKNPQDHAPLETVQQNSRSLANVFDVIGVADLAQLLRDVHPHIESIRTGASSASSAQKDALIDLYAGIDYYLESRLDHRDNLSEVLLVSKKSLAIIADPASQQDEFAAALEPIEASAEDIIEEDLDAAEVLSLDIELPEEMESVEEVELVEDQVVEEISEHREPAVFLQDYTDDVAHIDIASEMLDEAGLVDTDSGLVAAIAEEESTDVIKTPQVEAITLEEIDPEIFDIFMEESAEELLVVQEQYPRWRADPTDEEALKTFRRSFHTLKGSGRMVGANTIGEFAWSVESLLNRVLDGRVVFDERLTGVMDDVLELLPPLIKAQEEGTSFSLDIGGLQARVFALADGTAAPLEEAVDGVTISLLVDSELQTDDDLAASLLADEANEMLEGVELAAIEEAEEATAEDVPPIILVDDLYEIFNTESEMHLQIIADFVAQYEQAPCAISDELVRAIHTLRGSSHLAEVNSMAELAAAMEGLFGHLRRLGRPARDVPVVLLQRFHQSMSDTLHAINTPAAELPELQGLLADIQAAEQVLPEIISELNEAGQQAPPLDPEMVEIFLEEAAEVAERLENHYAEWSENTENMAAIDGLKRELHTLKGGARLAGLVTLGDLTHALESVFEALEETGMVANQSTKNVLRDALDEMENALDLLHLDGKIPNLSQETNMVLNVVQSIGVEADAESGFVDDSSLSSEFNDATESILLADEWNEDSDITDEPFLQVVPPATVEEPASASLSVSDQLDVDPEMLEIFLEEAVEISDQLETSFDGWSQDLTSQTAIDDFMRGLHTIKGNARFAGLTSLGDLTHSMETLFENLGSGELQPDESMVGLIRQALDGVGQGIDLLQKNRPLQQLEHITSALDLAGKGDTWALLESESIIVDDPTESLLYKSTTELTEETEIKASEQDSSFIADSKLFADSELFGDSQLYIETNTEIMAEALDANVIPFPEQEEIDFTRPDKRPPALQPEKAVLGAQQERVRVAADLLDSLVNNAGEVSIYRARLEQQSNTVNNNLQELTDTIGRLRMQLRSLELETETQVLSRHEREVGDSHYADFDPLEMDRYSTMQQLSRALSETINDLSNIGDTLGDLSRDTDTLLLQQARTTNDLQDGLLRTRMVPFNSQSARLQRVVRQTAQNLGKNAVLEVLGADGDIDRTILNRMMGPLEHLLRNAVAHGIELPAGRQQAEKSEQGKVTLKLSREGTEIVLTLTDDGAGLNAEAIREKAIKRKLLEEDKEITDEALYQFILQPGFSTVTEVTQVAGRGVGMDAVLSEVKQLGGSLEIGSELGQGSSFTIRLPFTLAISDALLVKVADEVFAIPHGSAETIIRATRQDLVACYSGKQSGIEYAGHEYPVRYLGSLLGLSDPSLSPANRWFPVLLVKSGEQRMAIQLDHLLGNFQVVVKSVGNQLSGVRWFTGGTILADGKIALLLDLNVLVRSENILQTAIVPVSTAEEEETAGITVMVVDDSITVRKVTSRLLERHNMTVITAKDGVDAVTVLQDHKPDVMLLDIEMPRMDGYELARHIRNTAELKDIPIIMITSRTGDKHRQRAMELGVNRYLGKPFQEADLLDNIYTLLAEHAYE